MRIATKDIDAACREFENASRGSAPRLAVDEAVERLRRAWDAFGVAGRTERLVTIHYVADPEDAGWFIMWMEYLASSIEGEVLSAAILKPTTDDATLFRPELLCIDDARGGGFVAVVVGAVPARERDIAATRLRLTELGSR